VVHEVGADLRSSGRKEGRESLDLDPSPPTSSEPHRRPRLHMHGGQSARG